MTIHSIKKSPPGLSPEERVRQQICQAIITIHAECRYYDGLDILCSLAGWGTFRNEFYASDEMNAWVRKQRTDMKEETKKPKRIKCKICNRYYDPEKVFVRKSKNKCLECGRRKNESTSRQAD